MFWITLNYYLIFYKQVKMQILLPYNGLCLYVILSALITGLARTGIGSWQALSSRYITTVNLFWISILVLLFIAINISSKKHQKFWFSFGLLIIIFFIALKSFSSINHFKIWHYILFPARQELMLKGAGKYASRLCPFQEYLIVERRPI